MKSFLIDLLHSVGMYLVIVVGGTSLFLYGAPIIGYVPAGDRPGPGWGELFPDVTADQLLDHASYVGGWAVFLALYAVVPGVFVFLAVRGIEYLNLPRKVVQIIGAGLAALLSGYLVLGIGWYIAIGEVAVNLSMILGGIFGAWLLPKKLGTPSG